MPNCPSGMILKFDLRNNRSSERLRSRNELVASSELLFINDVLTEFGKGVLIPSQRGEGCSKPEPGTGSLRHLLRGIFRQRSEHYGLPSPLPHIHTSFPSFRNDDIQRRHVMPNIMRYQDFQARYSVPGAFGSWYGLCTKSKMGQDLVIQICIMHSSQS